MMYGMLGLSSMKWKGGNDDEMEERGVVYSPIGDVMGRLLEEIESDKSRLYMF